MLAMRQIYYNAPAMIPIPEAFQHGNIEVILLLQDATHAISGCESQNLVGSAETGSEKVFFLLTQLSVVPYGDLTR